jgi:hypothetical protein
VRTTDENAELSKSNVPPFRMGIYFSNEFSELLFNKKQFPVFWQGPELIVN